MSTSEINNTVALAEYIALKLRGVTSPSAALLSMIITEHAMQNGGARKSPKSPSATVLAENPGKVVIFDEHNAEETTKFAENGVCLKAVADKLKEEFKASGVIRCITMNSLGKVVSISKKGDKAPVVLKRLYELLAENKIDYCSSNPLPSPTARTAYQEFVATNKHNVQVEKGLTSAEAMVETAKLWHESAEKQASIEKKKAEKAAKTSTSPKSEIMTALAGLPNVTFA